MFAKDIAPARTFTFEEDVEKLWASGLAKGGSMDCALVFDRFAKPKIRRDALPRQWARQLLDIGDPPWQAILSCHHGVRPTYAECCSREGVVVM